MFIASKLYTPTIMKSLVDSENLPAILVANFLEESLLCVLGFASTEDHFALFSWNNAL